MDTEQGDPVAGFLSDSNIVCNTETGVMQWQAGQHWTDDTSGRAVDWTGTEDTQLAASLPRAVW